MKKHKGLGLPPGTTLYTGQKIDLDIRINYIEFSDDYYKEEIDQNEERVLLHSSDKNIVQWYDIRGLHDVNLINKIGSIFKMHPIAMEDAVDVLQRPSFIEYDNAAFISLKSVNYNDQTNKIALQNVSLYFGEGFVISFQEHEDDIFEDIRSRIKNINARIRHRKSDYLAYAIVDYLVDNYFMAMDNMAKSIESLEEAISLTPEDVNKEEIFKLRKELQKLRKSISPLREALSNFKRSELILLQDATIAYIRDVADHTIQLMDSIDNNREILSGLQDLYISEISLKMNQIMQFLTIITAVFVPISFLAGLYGMNFSYMPELQFKYGYYALLTVMLLVILFLIWNFKRKKWL